MKKQTSFISSSNKRLTIDNNVTIWRQHFEKAFAPPLLWLTVVPHAFHHDLGLGELVAEAPLARHVAARVRLADLQTVAARTLCHRGILLFLAPLLHPLPGQVDPVLACWFAQRKERVGQRGSVAEWKRNTLLPHVTNVGVRNTTPQIQVQTHTWKSGCSPTGSCRHGEAARDSRPRCRSRTFCRESTKQTFDVHLQKQMNSPKNIKYSFRLLHHY